MPIDSEAKQPTSLERVVDLLRLDVHEHGLQCAYELRELYPDDVELQIAGLLHDVGHRVSDEASHGQFGAELVRPLFGDRVAQLVELHVPAKRYLVTVDPEYRDMLSEESVRTLELQGEAMSLFEVADFEDEEHLDAALALRRADERAKVPGRVVPGIEDWLPILELYCLDADRTSDFW